MKYLLLFEYDKIMTFNCNSLINILNRIILITLSKQW